MAENLMQSFWELSSLDDDNRILSAKSIVNNLSELQSPSSESNELQYCIQRLVKGLASNRKGVRHGYFITLTEVLKQFPFLLNDVFKLISANLERVGNAKAQEERGIYFGRVFAYLAVIESGTICTAPNIERISKVLIRVYNKKSYLQEFCAVSIGRLMAGIETELVYSSLLPYIGLDCGWEKCTPGKLYLLLCMLEWYSSDERLLKFLSLNWECDELISQNNLEDLSKVLMISSHSHPHVHVVWPAIINKLRGGHLWRDFWNMVVNDSLLVSSHERKYLCYKLIEEFILPSLKIDEVDVVFSSRLIQQLENNGATKHHLLHDAANHFLKQFPSSVAVSSNEGVSLSLAMQIIRCKNSNVFTSAIQQLLNNVTVVDLIKYVNCLINVLWTETIEPEKHQWMNQELAVLFKHISTSLKRNRSWLIILAKFLLLQTRFTVLKPVPKLNIFTVPVHASVTERSNYDDKLTNVIALLSDLKCFRGDESHDQDNISCDLWPVSLVLYIESLMNQNGCVELVTELDMETWSKGIDLIEGLYQKEDHRDCTDNAFLYLLSICLLDMIKNGGDKIVDTIEEIIVCHEKRTVSLRKTPKRKKTGAPSLDWMPVLMDILLGLLSNHNQFWRNTTERVFLWLKGTLTYETIQIIIKAIEPQNIEDVMEREITDTPDNDEGDIDEDDSKDCNETGDNEEESDDSEDSDEELVPGSFCDIGAEFRANVRNALGDIAAVDSDQESVTSLNEEAMDTLDCALSAVFLKQKEKSLAKKQKKTDNVAVMHFKMRVLELVGIYIRHQSTNPLMMEFLDPLLILVTKYNSHKTLSSLSERSRNLLDKLCKVKSYPKEGIDVDGLHLILKQLITKRLYSAQRLSPTITQCSMFLMRVLKGIHSLPTISPMATRSTRKRRHVEKEKEDTQQQSSSFGRLLTDDVVNWCSTALKDMITDKNCNVQTAFFITLSERQPEIAWRLLPTLASSLECAGNHFRKVQGYHILKAILGNYRLLSVESVIMLLKPVSIDLLNIMSQELMSLSVTTTRIAHYLSLIEVFSDTILTVQSYDELKDTLDCDALVKVLEHLNSFNDHKVSNMTSVISTSLQETIQPLRPEEKKRKNVK